MKKFIALFMFYTLMTSTHASENDKTDEAVQKAMEQEEKFAKEQKFYGAEDYEF